MDLEWQRSMGPQKSFVQKINTSTPGSHCMYVLYVSIGCHFNIFLFHPSQACLAVRHEIEKGLKVVQGRARVELPSPCSSFLFWVTLSLRPALPAQVDLKARVATPFLPSRRSPLSPLLKIVPRVNWASLARWDHSKFIRIHPFFLSGRFRVVLLPFFSLLHFSFL